MRRALLIAAALVPGCGPSDVAELRPEDVASVEVRPRLWTGPGEEPALARSDDPAVIGAVLAALRPVGEAPRHACAAPALLAVRRKSGRDLELLILPGHDPAFYEYKGGGGWRRVDRAPFLAAMKQLGAGWVPADCK